VTPVYADNNDPEAALKLTASCSTKDSSKEPSAIWIAGLANSQLSENDNSGNPQTVLPKKNPLPPFIIP